jgi:hypothetical protein
VIKAAFDAVLLEFQAQPLSRRCRCREFYFGLSGPDYCEYLESGGALQRPVFHLERGPVTVFVVPYCAKPMHVITMCREEYIKEIEKC